MFEQIKYALLDIKISKRISIIFFLQMVVVFLLINSAIVDIIRVNNGINRLEKLKDNKAYVNRDGTSNEKVNALIADKTSVPKIKELYQYIIDNKRIDKYSKWEFPTQETIEGNPILQATSNKMFFDIYDIKVIEGRMFNESDFTNKLETIPIVVGYNLKDRYKLGQVYSENDPVTNKNGNYSVAYIKIRFSDWPAKALLIAR